jgi:rubrerythrin
MSDSKFRRKIEDFVCENCGTNVKGSGYTNHCPECLWSKHVDVSPGDRLEKCGGLMEPVSIEVKGGEYTIFYRCTKCGIKKPNKSAQEDNFEVILKLSTNPIS